VTVAAEHGLDRDLDLPRITFSRHEGDGAEHQTQDEQDRGN